MNFIKNLVKIWSTEEDLFPPTTTIEETKFVVLDTETTGFDYMEDRILCIGAVKLQHNKIVVGQSFEMYVEQEHYDSQTAQIHGILRDFVAKKPSECEALKAFVSYVEDAILIAHHAFFDLTMINTALERNGMPILTNKVLDTGVLYKKTLIESNLFERKEHYTLDDLADKFDISKKDRHTALGDAYITAIAFLKIVKRMREKKEVNLNQLFKL